MYHASVYKIKRGMFGPRHVQVFDKISTTLEPLLAELSKYSDDWHVKHWQDFTESHGDYSGREDNGPTAWDAETGEPTEDERDRKGYHDKIADHYADTAHELDPDFPF